VINNHIIYLNNNKFVYYVGSAPTSTKISLFGLDVEGCFKILLNF